MPIPSSAEILAKLVEKRLFLNWLSGFVDNKCSFAIKFYCVTNQLVFLIAIHLHDDDESVLDRILLELSYIAGKPIESIYKNTHKNGIAELTIRE